MSAAGGIVLAGGQQMSLTSVTNDTTMVLTTTTANYTLTNQISTDVAKDASGVFTVTATQTAADQSLLDFLDAWQDESVSADTEEITYESGQKLTGSGSSKTLLAIVKGSVVSGGASAGKTLLWYGVVTVSNESGSFTQEADTYVKMSFILNGVAVKGTLTIPTAAFTGFGTTPTQQVISPTSRKYGRIVNM